MSLTEAIGDLHAALDIGAKRMPDLLGESTAILDKAVERRSLGADVTIVALAGSTGAGKSSLLNALVGRQIARASAIRPTTSEALAVTNAQAADVLDWLEIHERHEADLTAAGGMVLIDLPDIDSTEFVHRETAKKLTSLVDVVVWVLDPQKYADAVVHEDYLSNLAEHAATTIVVLNQADRLDDETLTNVVSDAERLMREDGLEVDVIPTSAVTGRGLVKLWERLDRIVEDKSAADERLAADIRTAGRNMIGGIHTRGGKKPGQATDPDFTPVAAALAKAGGADVVADAAAGSYTKRARAASGWPVTRWLAQRKIDPLKRLRLDGDRAQVTGTSEYVSPALATAAQGRVRDYVDESTAHMPREWARDVQSEMRERAERFLTGIDRVVTGVDVEAKRRPAWWFVFNLLQWLALIVAIVGGVWLLLLIFADTLKLQLGEPPAWGIFPAPTIMLVGGLLLGWLLAAIGRALAGAGANRTRERVRRRLTTAIGDEARAELLTPLEEERATYARFFDLLGSLARAAS